MKKIKVLEFSRQWAIGGGEHSFQLFIKNMNRDKFNIIVGGFRGGARLEKIQAMGIETFIEEDPKKLVEWMKTQNFDIVHFLRMGVTEPEMIDPFVEAGIPILIEHNAFGLFDSSVDRTKIHKHVMCSKTTHQIYSKRAGVFYEPEKISVVYCPVEGSLFRNYKFERDWSAPIFGKHARKDHSKWHPLNFQVLPIIRDAIPDAKFYAKGIPDEYRDMIKQLKVEDMIVEFPSDTDDKEVLNFLNKITIFTHANIYGESFGCAIAEAMASGLPVTTHTGGDSAQCELITDGFNGFISDPNDYVGHANKIIHLLKNPELKKTMGEAGRKRCFDWFDGPIVTKKLEDTFIEEYNKINKSSDVVSLSSEHYTVASDWREKWSVSDYIQHVQTSIDNGLARKSRCDDFPLGIHGMSTPEFRSLLNNLCSPSNANYLEIGTWTGGTCCSAVSNNPTLTSFLIDNFTYLQDEHNVKNTLISNINRVEKTTKDVTFLEGDCFSMNQDLITKKIDFYLFDALHTRENQKRALTDFIDKMHDKFVYIADDYNEKDVQDGTLDAITELKDRITVHKEWIFLTPKGFSPLWHNGCYIAVISKK